MSEEVPNGEKRRERILQLLRGQEKPMSAGSLAKRFHVSRQVIVQDVALLRANGEKILSTNRGYLLNAQGETARVFKVHHLPEETERELTLIVELGGSVKDVFVYHKVYGVLRGELNLSTLKEVQDYLQKIRSGRSTLLSGVTSGYHYHTVTAKSERILDLIQKQLSEEGFLAELVEFEPVVFGKRPDS